MINCKDIYGNQITHFIFNEDGTVVGTSQMIDNSLELNEAQYGVKSYANTVANPLSPECCNALNFRFDYSSKQCYYRRPCTGIDEPTPVNGETLEQIDFIKSQKDEIKSRLVSGTISSPTISNLNNQLNLLENTLSLLENQLKPNDIHLIFGANGNNPVLFSVPNAQGDLDPNEEERCEKELASIMNQIFQLNNQIAQHQQAINHINQIIDNINSAVPASGEEIPETPSTRGYNITSLQAQLESLEAEIESLLAQIAELQQQYNDLYAVCNPIPPKCVLNIEFDYLWNFDCEELLTCAVGDNSTLESLTEQYETCTANASLILEDIDRHNLNLSEIATQISEYQITLANLEAQLEGNTDPVDVYLINQQINNINAELSGLANQYIVFHDNLVSLQESYSAQTTFCATIQEQINVINNVGNVINALQGVVFYLTVNKKVLNPITSSYVWETVYTEEFFRIDDFLQHITNNSQTGIYFSGDRCDELIENISTLLGENCNAISASTFNSNWLHLSTTISDPNTILEIVNEEIAFGIAISYNNPSCEYCIMIDHIQMNQICEQTEDLEVVITKCPGFELRRLIDNKKSWMDIASGHTREFDLTNRDTYYKTPHYKAVINSKEIDLEVSPASAIEFDTYNYISTNPCVLSGDSGQTNYIDYLSTDFDEINNIDEFKWVIYSELIDVKTRKVLSGYPVLKAIYERYLTPSYYGCTGTTSNGYTYCDMIDFTKLLGTFWIDLIEQVIPSTTIWGSVYTYRNSIFDSNKFKYKRYSLNYCDPIIEECPLNSGSTIMANIIIEDLSKEIGLEYPECFIAASPLKTCNYIQTIDYDDSCEYRGRVTIINPDISGDSPNIIDGGGVVAIENVNYYSEK